jgi:phosphoglycolate phosphatase-like HAD superfamily hydrolase
VSELLVLWDVDYTLLSSAGLGTRLYEATFREMFGRELTVVAPKAGRTDRAILLETLTLAGIAEPRAHVEAFLAALARQSTALARQSAALARQSAARNGTAANSTAVNGRAADEVHAPPAADEAYAVPGAADEVHALPDMIDEVHALPDMIDEVHALPGAAAAIGALAAAGVRQSVLTGNIRPLAELKLGLAGLGAHLDLDVGAYGDVHEVRAELVPVARRAAAAAYGLDFGGPSTVRVGDTPLDVAAALATGARAVGVATGSFPASDLVAACAHVVLPDLTDTALLLAAITGRP